MPRSWHAQAAQSISIAFDAIALHCGHICWLNTKHLLHMFSPIDAVGFENVARLYLASVFIIVVFFVHPINSQT